MRLGVNIDHVATLRQARRGSLPDPVDAALICERAGADSIVCHLREDRRHIQDADVRRLKTALRTRLNLEMSTARGIVEVALSVRPAQVTLVPERRQELTTEGGLDAVALAGSLGPIVAAFQAQGIEVRLFVDPLTEQLNAAWAVGARIVELHTGRYANAQGAQARAQECDALRRAAGEAQALGLAVAAGHGLDYQNVGPIVGIPGVAEVNIGFSIISRSLTVGLEEAVAEMLQRLRPGHHVLEVA